MAWNIEFDIRATKDLKSLSKEDQKQIITFLKSRIAISEDPKNFGKPLVSGQFGLWRYRVGKYRIICQIKNKEFIVLVVSVGKRDKIYTKLDKFVIDKND